MSGCCKHDHMNSAAELICYFLPLSAASSCSTFRLINAGGFVAVVNSSVQRNSRLRCACVKDKLG